jgi:hypothetical protein
MFPLMTGKVIFTAVSVAPQFNDFESRWILVEATADVNFFFSWSSKIRELFLEASTAAAQSASSCRCPGVENL